MAVLVVAVGAMSLAIRVIIPALWEKGLMGPYAGTEIPVDQVPGVETSSLALARGGERLVVHEDPEGAGPILALKTPDGKVSWARRLLVPDSRRRMQNLEMISVSKSLSGYKVRIICDWDMGREAGVVYLGKDMRFRQFSLSW